MTLQYQRREYDRQEPYKNSYLILEETIPAGCSVLEQSIQGGVLDYEIRDGRILFYLNKLLPVVKTSAFFQATLFELGPYFLATLHI